MVSGDIFKRRRNHNNTPKYVLLIITNYVVCCSLFTLDTRLNWFFFSVIALLAVYNFFVIRKNIEEFIKPVIITYTISVTGILLLFILAHNNL